MRELSRSSSWKLLRQSHFTLYEHSKNSKDCGMNTKNPAVMALIQQVGGPHAERNLRKLMLTGYHADMAGFVGVVADAVTPFADIQVALRDRFDGAGKSSNSGWRIGAKVRR